MNLKYKIFYSIIVVLVCLPSFLYGQEGYRTEKDLLGEKQIPNDAYYGVQTLPQTTCKGRSGVFFCPDFFVLDTGLVYVYTFGVQYNV